MFIPTLCVPLLRLNQRIRHYASGPETHYDVLNLKSDCTAEEIRSAFIKLSKKYHPDAKGSKNPKDTAKFVRISEAYQVLSKTRDAYDQNLLFRGTGQSTKVYKNPEVHRPWEVRPNYNPNPGPYYGVRGWKRVSNAKVASVIVGFVFICISVGFISLRMSFAASREQLLVKSKKAEEQLADIRENARKLGNDEQLKRLIDKLIVRSD